MMRQLKIIKQITNRETDSLARYLSEIGKIDMITPADEAELAKRIREGDQMALEKMASANLRFVVSVAKQYQNRGMSLIDLINEGNYGLIKAAKRFDETRGFKFISYAVWWIRQAMMQALAQHAMVVRLPQNRISSAARIAKAIAELEQQLQRIPTHEELADVLQVPLADISNNISISTRHLSLNAPMTLNEDACLLDTLENHNEKMPDSDLLNESLCIETRRALSTLTDRESLIITLYFGLNAAHVHSLEEIGDKLTLTSERVRQIKDKALRKLRNRFSHEGLRSYLPAIH